MKKSRAMIVRERKRKGAKREEREIEEDREGDKLDMIPPDTVERLTWTMSLGRSER